MLLALTAATALIASNLYLLRRNRALNTEVTHTNISLLPPVGRIVPALHGFDVAGRPLTVAYGQDPRPTLLFVLSPHCEYCSRTWPAWERVLARTDRRRFRPVFVSLLPGLTQDYVADHHLTGVLILRSIEPQDPVAYNMLMTPEIIEITPQGVVRNAWVGELDTAAEAKLTALVSN